MPVCIEWLRSREVNTKEVCLDVGTTIACLIVHGRYALLLTCSTRNVLMTNAYLAEKAALQCL